ncbi:hypothetical protein HYH02_009433 [Chlamydomonas schloesseri]|uniref:Argonaute-like protein n=1 Tax=Chlamydomonas schloesseri TaxID=2026947 RepID=A0A835TCM5_9CHLO|nr:hypothetical protein HYH02_009433 [Chlamydomonas schloesseri]|eukprot:KAG2443017.1 hypothetical protein HYH02_009433 [Chlamydomonas schloesseri]
MQGNSQLPRRAAGRPSRVAAVPVVARASRPGPPVGGRSAGGRGGSQQGRGGGGRSSPGTSPLPRELLTQLQYAPQWWTKVLTNVGPVQPSQLPNGRAARPGHSRAGRPIEVLTNHVPLAVGVRVVHQYDVRISRVSGSPDGASSSSSSSADAGSSGSSSSKGSGKGGAARGGRKEAKVAGQEAHAVLAQLLGGGAGAGSSSSSSSWVFDGSQALYSVDADLRRRAASVASTSGGGDGEGQLALQMAAAPAAGVVGGTYKVELKLVGALDVAECLKEAAQLQQPARQTPPADDEDVDQAAPLPPTATTTSPSGSGSGSSSSPRAAALAVLDLVTRAGVAWDPASVRTGGGAYVSYKQEDASGPVKGLLPLKLLRGFRSAVAQVAAGTTLTVDAASAVVAGDGPLLSQLQASLAAGRSVSDLASELSRNARRLEEALVGLEVQPSYTANRYKLSGKLGKSARDITFKLPEGRSVTVEAYLKERYGVTLKYPGLPCVLDKKGGALPIELLSVVKYQKRMSRLDARQKADYIRTAALRPQDRLKAMREALAKQLGSVKGQVAAAFGLQLREPDFLKVPAQLLPGPLLQVARQQAVEPGNKGEWAGGGVAVAPAWRSGAVLCYLDQGEAQGPLKKLLTSLDKALTSASASPLPADLPVVWASAPKPGLSPDKVAADAQFWLERAAGAAEKKYGQRAQMVMVVLPAKGGPGLYESIKAAGDGKLGLATQCVNPAKAGLVGPKAADGPSFSYAAQLALGVNAKLGGATTRPAGRPKDWLPLLGDRRLMVLGADLSRGAAVELSGRGADPQLAAAAAESEAQVSGGVEYAAVVGSADSHAVDYRVQLSAQVTGNRDIVVGMRESVARLLLQYGRPPGAAPGAAAAATVTAPRPASELPEVLLMYRDGLSESQFDMALAVEYEAIKQACVDVGGPGYRPPITFVVVQKSHNTRFFPISSELTHKSGNVLPGTAVDRGVTDPVAFDFFLNSHAGIQGTNRAPRYTVLVDEVGFTAEALQQLTHTLCHTYPACTRALSHPPPVRYADRAADRARTLRYASSRASGKQQARGAGWYELLPSPAHAGHVV